MPYTVRPIEPRDNAAIERIIRDSLTEFGGNREGFAWADPSLSSMAAAYAPEGCAYWVAEDETGTVVGGMGIAPLEDEEGTCELQKLYCVPEARGAGAAHLLMAEGMAFAGARYRCCYLETMGAMHAAHRFYAKYDFHRLDAPLGNTGHSGCDVWMAKNLHAVDITVLIDNLANDGAPAPRVGAGNAAPATHANAASNTLQAEWGFAAYIEFNGRTILLDTGASSAFARNAELLGKDLAAVEYGVLSHAHYDHSDGMDEFFRLNQTAAFHLREGAAENCYHYGEDGEPEYIGIKRGTLAKHRSRIVFVSGNHELFPGALLVPHTTPGLNKIGATMGMFTLEETGLTGAATGAASESAPRATSAATNADAAPTVSPVVETFAHEQSLVLDTPRGLVIFNSCSHGGVDAIIAEAQAALPGRPVHALIGGLHLYKTAPEDVRALAQRIRELGIHHVYTGHCTGDEAFAILKTELGEAIQQFHSGFVAKL